MGKSQNRQNQSGRDINKRKNKASGEYQAEPKPKWVEDRAERSKGVHIQPLNEHQQQLLDSFEANYITIGTGSAGTGKTMLACYYAAKELLAGNISKIVITRPYVAVSNRTTGFKPKDDLEKLRGFVLPMIGYLSEILTVNVVEAELQKSGRIELAPLESIRGRNFDNAIIIVDESSNTTIGEVQAITTRVGKNCKLIMIGDNAQTDMPDKNNGLLWFEKLCRKHNISSVGIIKFNHDDIVRSDIVKELIIAFEQEGGYVS